MKKIKSRRKIGSRILVLLGLAILLFKLKTSATTSEKSAITDNQQSMGEVESLTDDNPGERWSVIENQNLGYRFAYPADFELDSELDGKVELIPSNKKGIIIVYIKDKSFDIQFPTDNLSAEDAAVFAKAKNLIESTFEFTGQN